MFKREETEAQRNKITSQGHLLRLKAAILPFEAAPHSLLSGLLCFFL